MKCEDVDLRWKELGERGFTVSICYGPSKGKLIYTVCVLFPDGSMTDRPFEAMNLYHAMQIAVCEAQDWIQSRSIKAVLEQ